MKKELEKKYNFILELEKEEKKKELEKNNILVKNNSFTLTEEQKKIIEEKYNYNFSKKYFSTKNIFLYNIVKEELEKNGFTFLTEKELNTKTEEELEELVKALEEQKKIELEHLELEKNTK